MPQTTRTMPAVAGLLALLAAGCAAPRYQGPPVGADRVAAAREEIAARLAGGSGEASAGVPARPWAEPELRDMFARVVRAAEPLCAAERVGCRFELRLAADAGEANAFASGERDVTLTGPLLDRLATAGENA